MPNFSRPLNLSVRTIIWKRQFEANFVFRLFNLLVCLICSLVSGPMQSFKKNVSAICRLQFQWKVTENYGVTREKHCSWREKELEIKKLAHGFLLFTCQTSYYPNLRDPKGRSYSDSHIWRSKIENPFSLKIFCMV